MSYFYIFTVYYNNVLYPEKHSNTVTGAMAGLVNPGHPSLLTHSSTDLIYGGAVRGIHTSMTYLSLVLILII